MREALRQQLRHWRQRGDGLKARLALLGPEQVLARGYSITLEAASKSSGAPGFRFEMK